MDKDRLKEMARDERFIPGIYNYCDRWCERCAFTSRCLNYAMQEEESADPAARDIANAAFWEKLAETLRMTHELLEDLAKEQGVDLNALDIQAQEDEGGTKRQKAENHICCVQARLYGEMVGDVLDSAGDLLDERQGLLNLLGAFPPQDSSLDGPSTPVGDALEVILWYQHQIYVKLMRAVQGAQDEESEGVDASPRDLDGSAKVALTGIDRSMAAWGVIQGRVPTLHEEAVAIVAHLAKLRRKVEKTFPRARAFIRPGFDTHQVS
jgi:hypothetical protein